MLVMVKVIIIIRKRLVDDDVCDKGKGGEGVMMMVMEGQR